MEFEPDDPAKGELFAENKRKLVGLATEVQRRVRKAAAGVLEVVAPSLTMDGDAGDLATRTVVRVGSALIAAEEMGEAAGGLVPVSHPNAADNLDCANTFDRAMTDVIQALVELRAILDPPHRKTLDLISSALNAIGINDEDD